MIDARQFPEIVGNVYLDASKKIKDAAPNLNDLPGRDQLLDIRETAIWISQNFPADRYHYVGVGQSPTPYLRLLEAMHPGSTTDLPLSRGGKWRWIDRTPAEYTMCGNNDGPGWRGTERDTRIMAHCDRHIVIPYDKTLLLIDFCLTGGSLIGGMTVVKEWLKRRGCFHKVEGLGLEHVDHSPHDENVVPEGFVVHWHKLDGVMTHRLMGQDYDRWSRYGKWYGDVDHDEYCDECTNYRILRDVLEWAVREEKFWTEGTGRYILEARKKEEAA